MSNFCIDKIMTLSKVKINKKKFDINLMKIAMIYNTLKNSEIKPYKN